MSEDSEKILGESLHAMAQDIKERDDEIERLREALQSSCDEQRQLFRDEANFPCEAAIENEVLRGLLRDLGVCVDWYIVSDNLKRRIREALGDE
jgi:hypothetical protein